MPMRSNRRRRSASIAKAWLLPSPPEALARPLLRVTLKDIQRRVIVQLACTLTAVRQAKPFSSGRARHASETGNGCDGPPSGVDSAFEKEGLYAPCNDVVGWIVQESPSFGGRRNNSRQIQIDARRKNCA